MSSKDEYLDIILNKLSMVKQELVSINEKSGALQRVQQMRDEILSMGWQGIVDKYHPDVNIDDPASKELFRMYKFVYEDMKKRLTLSIK